MLIVEGPDGSGKTTLCQKLAEDFDIPIMNWETELGISRDDLKENPTQRYYHALALELSDSRGQRPFIHDRLYFSSLVYGPLMQGNIQMSPEDSKLISRLLLAFACPIIMCMPPKDVVLENMKKDDHQMEGVRELQGDVYDAYQALFTAKDQVFPYCLWYDYTETQKGDNYWNYDLLKPRIEFYLNRRAQRTFR